MKYDWPMIQKMYDSGKSYRDIISEIGVSMQALNNASKRGYLIPRSRSEAMKITRKKYGPNKMSDAARRKQSIRLSYNNRGGRCKWYTVSGVRVQGRWERNIAKKLNSLDIKWEKLKTHRDVWSYYKNNELKSYTPDFFLPDYNIYLEIKGYWWGNDKEKVLLAQKYNPDKKLLIIEKEEYQKILKGELVW